MDTHSSQWWWTQLNSLSAARGRSAPSVPGPGASQAPVADGVRVAFWGLFPPPARQFFLTGQNEKDLVSGRAEGGVCGWVGRRMEGWHGCERKERRRKTETGSSCEACGGSKPLGPPSRKAALGHFLTPPLPLLLLVQPIMPHPTRPAYPFPCLPNPLTPTSRSRLFYPEAGRSIPVCHDSGMEPQWNPPTLAQRTSISSAA